MDNTEYIGFIPFTDDEPRKSALVSCVWKTVKHWILMAKPTRCTCFTNLFILNTTLHVSDGISVHHQEFKTVHTAIGIYQTDTATCLLVGMRWKNQYRNIKGKLYTIHMAIWYNKICTINTIYIISTLLRFTDVLYVWMRLWKTDALLASVSRTQLITSCVANRLLPYVKVSNSHSSNPSPI